MQCPRCGYFTLPGQTECPRCTVNVSTSPLDIEPPRAGKMKLFRKIKYFLNRRFPQYFPTFIKLIESIFQANPWMIYILWSIIPGLGHVKNKSYRRALSFISVFLIILIGLVFFWGTTVGRCFVAALLFCHVYCMLDAARSYFIAFSMSKRLIISLFMSFFLLLCVYTPVHFLRLRIIEDVIITFHTHIETFDIGDMVLVNRALFAPERLKHGDVVMFKLDGGTVDRMVYKAKYNIFVRATTCIDRVLGIPGDTVEFSEDAILINGKKLPKELYPLNIVGLPKEGKATVPKNHCFVYPSLLDFGRHGQRFNSVQYKLDKGILPFKSIDGRVFMVYQPLKKRRFL